MSHLAEISFCPETADLPAEGRETLDNPLVGLISVMDHSPGPRQHADLAAYRARVLRHGSMTEETVDRHIETRTTQSATYGVRPRLPAEVT